MPVTEARRRAILRALLTMRDDAHVAKLGRVATAIKLASMIAFGVVVGIHPAFGPWSAWVVSATGLICGMVIGGGIIYGQSLHSWRVMRHYLDFDAIDADLETDESPG